MRAASLRVLVWQENLDAALSQRLKVQGSRYITAGSEVQGRYLGQETYLLAEV